MGVPLFLQGKPCADHPITLSTKTSNNCIFFVMLSIEKRSMLSFTDREAIVCRPQDDRLSSARRSAIGRKTVTESSYLGIVKP